MSATSSSGASGAKKNANSLPFGYQLLAGGVAGVTELSAMYPLDVVKTRLQLQRGKGDGSSQSVVSVMGKIFREEGIKRLYRGILAPVLVEAPKRAVKFAANDSYQKMYRNTFPSLPAQPLATLTGVSAGCTEAFVVVPFELVKIRLQDKASQYRSTLDCLRGVLRNEGLIAFYTGLESTVWRHAMWNGGYFSVIRAVSDALPEPQSYLEKVRNHFIAGTIGGTVGTILNTPFDVVKTRVQNQMSHDNVGTTKYGWTLPAVKTIMKEEGVAALYKGFVPKVLRLGPGGGILYVVYDQVCSFLINNVVSPK